MSEPTQEPERRAGKGAEEPGARAAAVRQVAEVTRTLIAQEFARAERLESKGRNGFAIAAGWFAAVQTVTGLTTPKDHAWVLVLPLISAIALVAAFVQARQVWKAREVNDMKPEVLKRALNAAWHGDAARQEDAELRLARHAIASLTSFRSVNAERADALQASEGYTAASFVVSSIQIAIVLVVAVA